MLQLNTLPPHILELGLTYLTIVLVLILFCALLRPQSIDAIIRLLEELYRLLYHESKRRTSSRNRKRWGKK